MGFGCALAVSFGFHGAETRRTLKEVGLTDWKLGGIGGKLGNLTFVRRFLDGCVELRMVEVVVGG